MIKFDTQYNFNEQGTSTPEVKNKVQNFAVKLIKKALYEHKYNQIGRLPRFFLASELQQIKEFELQMWPGYTMDVKQVTDGIFANVDTATKFIQMKTVLDGINDMVRDRWSRNDIIAEYVPKDQDAKRLVVITMYNSRTY